MASGPGMHFAVYYSSILFLQALNGSEPVLKPLQTGIAIPHGMLPASVVELWRQHCQGYPEIRQRIGSAAGRRNRLNINTKNKKTRI